MKVGVFIDRLNVGGVEKIAIEQVRSLRKEGVDAQLVVMREKSNVENPFPDLINTIPVTYLDRRLPRLLRVSFKFPFFYFFSFFHLSYAALLPFVVKRKEFDYFFVHGTYTSFTAITIKKLKGINFSAFIWDPASYILERVYKQKANKALFWVLGKLMRFADKLVISQMDYILVGGDAHNSFLRKLNPRKRIVTIYPSVDPDKKPFKKERYIQMATAWKNGKNPEYVIELAKSIPNYRIKMVGKWLDPNYYDEFMKQVDDNGLGKQIEVVGEVTEKELANSYRRALVVLQTNDDKGFGMPALEAAAHGSTFIIPRGQGVCKLFKHGEDGYFVKEKDTKQISEYLEQLFKHPEKAVEMGERARKKVVANYSWSIHAQKLIELATQAVR